MIRTTFTAQIHGRLGMDAHISVDLPRFACLENAFGSYIVVLGLTDIQVLSINYGTLRGGLQKLDNFVTNVLQIPELVEVFSGEPDDRLLYLTVNEWRSVQGRRN